MLCNASQAFGLSSVANPGDIVGRPFQKRSILCSDQAECNGSRCWRKHRALITSTMPISTPNSESVHQAVLPLQHDLYYADY